MSNTIKKGWLSSQVESARKNLDDLPEWVKKSARFEGSDNRTFVAKGNSTKHSNNK